MSTVNSEIFARVLFLRNFAYIYALNAIFNVANMSLNAIRENKILAEISEFTVKYKKTHSNRSLTCIARTLFIPPLQNFRTKYLKMCKVYIDVGGIK